MPSLSFTECFAKYGAKLIRLLGELVSITGNEAKLDNKMNKKPSV
jgi:hypothetical protein